MAINFKFQLQDQIRRCLVDEDSSCSYEVVWSVVRRLYKDHVFTENQVLRYIDDEGDKIIVSSDEELSCALLLMNSMNVSTFKFEIVSEPVVPAAAFDINLNPTAHSGIHGFASMAAHPHVVCDECGTVPITGVRYKCTVRNDFDLCSGCEAKVPLQPFPMFKLYTSEQNKLLNGVGGFHVWNHGDCRRKWYNSHVTPQRRTDTKLRDVAHSHVVCDACGGSPIIGCRYKCLVRNDYDLCASCESKSPIHPYPMIKIYHPEQNQYIRAIFLNHCGRNTHVNSQVDTEQVRKLFEVPPATGPCEPGLGPSDHPRGRGGLHGRMNGRPCGRGRGNWFHQVGSASKDVVDFAAKAVVDVLDGLKNPHRQRDRSMHKNPACQKAEPKPEAPGSGSTFSCPQPAVESTSAPAAPVQDNRPTEKEAPEGEWALLEGVLQQSLLEVVESLKEATESVTSENTGDDGPDMKLNVNSATSSSPVADDTCVTKQPVATEMPTPTESITVVAPESSDSAAEETPPTDVDPYTQYEVENLYDITYPKGSTVPVGSVFKKIWRVKNSGSVAWPEDTSLVVYPHHHLDDDEDDAANVRYELFCSPNTNIHVGAIQPGEEIMVSVQMDASVPDDHVDTNRYVSIFCFSSPSTDTQMFSGDLLYLDIFAVAQDSSFSTGCIMPNVSESTVSTSDSTHSASRIPSGASSSPTPSRVSDSGWQVIHSGIAPLSTTTDSSDTCVNSASDNAASENEMDQSSTGGINEEISIWNRELEVLSDMGYSDLPALVSLLKQHVAIPKSTLINTHGSDVPSGVLTKHTEGMQRVVMTLLGISREG